MIPEPADVVGCCTAPKNVMYSLSPAFVTCTIAGRTFSTIDETSVETVDDVVVAVAALDILPESLLLDACCVCATCGVSSLRNLLDTVTTDWNASPATNPKTSAIAAVLPSFAPKPEDFLAFLFFLPSS